MMVNKVITLLLLGILFSSESSATVTLNGCPSDDVCAGVDVSYTCTADTGNIQIVLSDTENTPVLDVVFNDTDALGNVQSETVVGSVNVWYNKTSNMSIRVWFTADVALNGYRFECKDIENDTDIETSNCMIGVNGALARPTQFRLDDTMYCDMANFTWGVMGDDTCLKDFVVQTMPASSSGYTEYVIEKDIYYYDDLTVIAINQTEYCVSVASRNYMRTSDFSAPLCVAFNVTKAPRGLMQWYNVMNIDDDGDLTVTIRWMAPDTTRPYVMNYYISTNITDSDDDGSGSGDDNREGNEFVTRKIPGNRTMMMLHGAREGYYYTVTLWAENCIGNSSESVITFRVMANPDPSTTSSSTMPMTGTVTPSPSPTAGDDPDVLPTYVIIIIAVVGAVFLILLIGIPILICCCCLGGVACCVGCAVCSDSAKSPHDMEMAGHGTKL